MYILNFVKTGGETVIVNNYPMTNYTLLLIKHISQLFICIHFLTSF